MPFPGSRFPECYALFFLYKLLPEVREVRLSSDMEWRVARRLEIEPYYSQACSSCRWERGEYHDGADKGEWYVGWGMLMAAPGPCRNN